MDILQNSQPVFKTFKVRQSEDRLGNSYNGHRTTKGSMAPWTGFWSGEKILIKNYRNPNKAYSLIVLYQYSFPSFGNCIAVIYVCIRGNWEKGIEELPVPPYKSSLCLKLFQNLKKFFFFLTGKLCSVVQGPTVLLPPPGSFPLSPLYTRLALPQGPQTCPLCRSLGPKHVRPEGVPLLFWD